MVGGKLLVQVVERSVVEHLLKEEPHEWQGSAAALALSRAEVYLAVLAAHPCATHEIGGDGHEPGVGVVVAGAGLAANAHIASDVAIDGGSGAASVGAHRLEHATHAIGLIVRQGAAGVVEGAAVVDLFFLTILVGAVDAGHEHRVLGLAVVDHGGIAGCHLQQVHVARAQAQRWGLVEGRLDAHVVGGLRHLVDAHLVAHLHGDDVVASRYGGTHGHALIRETATGVAGLPQLGVAGLGVTVHERCGKGRVHVLVARSLAVFDGCTIDKYLESAARLMLGTHVVILPCLVVNIAHPGFHLAGVGVHGDEAAVHLVEHVFY